jgi:hypothetical protein
MKREPECATPSGAGTRSSCDEDAEQALADLRTGFERAARANPSQLSERFYRFGGGVVRLRVVGHALARLIDHPFAHLRLAAEPAGDPDLSIDLFDAAETGTPCQLRSSPLARGHVTASADGRILVQERDSMKSAFDRHDGQIVSLAAGAELMPLTEHRCPLYLLLLLWHQDRGLPTVHAGLVARAGAGVLLGGPGGAGKSTTSLCCLLAGFQYLSDDYVALENISDGTFVGHGLYASAYLAPDHLERFPHLLPHAVEGTRPEEAKHAVLLADLFPDRLGRSATIRALVLPRVSRGRSTVVRPARKTEALLRLAPSSILQVPQANTGQRSFRHLSRLVESVPTFWLELGRDMEEIPQRVSEILAEVCDA